MNDLERHVRAIAKKPNFEWTTNDADVIGTALSDRTISNEARALAAACAGDLAITSDDSVLALLSIARDATEPLRVRRAAAIALGPALEDADTMDDDRVISVRALDRLRDGLRATFDDPATPDDVRRAVLEASVRAPADWHPKAVRDGLAKTASEWRRTAVFCMQYLPNFDDEIVRALDDRDEITRHWAIVAAGVRGVDAAWEKVVAILQARDTDKDDRIQAIEAVAQIRPEDAGPLLVEFVDSDDPDIADAANEAMLMADGAL